MSVDKQNGHATHLKAHENVKERERRPNVKAAYREILKQTQEHLDLLASFGLQVKNLDQFEHLLLDQVDSGSLNHELLLRMQEQLDFMSQCALRIEDLERLEKHQVSQDLGADETRGALKAYRAVLQALRELSVQQEHRWSELLRLSKAAL
jgi:hypothetical protein